MAKIIPVILSGGSGTRLWPLSRAGYPKQYIRLDDKTLFGECLERVRALDDVAPPLVICNQEHRFLAASIMFEHGMSPCSGEDISPRLILEPVGRGTAPAIAVAAFAALELAKGDDPMLLVLPSDHKIEPQSAFASSVEQAAKAAASGRLMTFGVRPEYPATGYGYIIRGAGNDGAFKVERFVEKPDEATAKAMIEEGGCFWNSGMFIFRAAVILNELKRFAPKIYEKSLLAWEKRRNDLDFIRIDSEAFSSSPNDSIDCAVLERTDKAAVVPFGAASWHDLGSWESFHELAPKDADGNSSVGDALLIDSKNSYVYSSSRLVAAVGLESIVVVESPDAVLVMQEGHGQDVKKLLDILKSKDRSEVDTHLKVHRPWGSYETLALGEYFQVKHIVVKPGAGLSLQMHKFRAEHWVVVRGVAKVMVGDEERIIEQNESTYIPRETKHRLINPTHRDLEIIEVQSGSYLGEDDIIRFEDTYGRSPN